MLRSLRLSLLSHLQLCLSQWNNFWFAPKDLYTLSLLRVGLCGTMFFMYLTRFYEIELFYFNSGLMDADTARQSYSEFNKPFLYLFPNSDTLIYLFHMAFLLGLLLITLGLSHRIFIFGVFLLHLCFIQRNPFIVYGADLYATFWLFFLCFMKHTPTLTSSLT